MVKDALEYFIGEKLVKYEGPSTLNIQLNAQEEKNRDVLHILHYITEKRSEDIYTVEDKIPLYDLENSGKYRWKTGKRSQKCSG